MDLSLEINKWKKKTLDLISSSINWYLEKINRQSLNKSIQEKTRKKADTMLKIRKDL